MLLNKKYATRGTLYLGLLAMLLLLALAWHFYLERVAYYDLAYHVFTFIRLKTLFIQNRRFVAAVTQLPPLLAVRAGWPIDHILRLYSLTFALYYLVVYLLSAKWLKNEQVALVVVFLSLLISSSTFFWAQSELPQSLAALLFFYAGVARQAPLPPRFSTLALAALVPVFIFGHPVAIFAFLFIWVYDWLLNQRWRDWLYYGLLALALLMYVYRASLIPPGSYEDTNNSLKYNVIHLFPHYLELGSFTYFWELCRNNFMALPIMMALLTAYYLVQRSRLALLRLLLLWAAVVTYTLIINISFPAYGGATYIENLFLPLTIIIGIPFACELLPALEQRLGRRGAWLSTGLLVVLFGARFLAVYRAHEPFTGYQQWLQRTLAYTKQFPEHRFLAEDGNVDPFRLRVGSPGWASSYETVLLSTRPSPDSAQVLFLTNELPRFSEIGKMPGLFVSAFDVISSKDLPTNYIHLGNEAATYRVLNTPPPVADTAALGAYIAARRQTKLDFVAFPNKLKAGAWRTVRIQISVPTTGQPLHSGLQTPYPTMVRTRFTDPTGWPTYVPPIEAPLEVDVWQPWQQDIPLNCPSEAGKYELEVTLISKKYRDWPVQLRIPVEIP